MGMGDDTNQYAFDGGDTAPTTAAQIKARNEAMQAFVEEQNAIRDDTVSHLETVTDRRIANEETLDAALLEAENAVPPKAKASSSSTSTSSS